MSNFVQEVFIYGRWTSDFGHPPTGKTRLDECLRIHVIAKTTQEIGKVTKNVYGFMSLSISYRKNDITESLLEKISYFFFSINQSVDRTEPQ